MPTSISIRVLCVKMNISVAELARRNGSSPQAFNQKLKRDGFTPIELDRIAKSVGCMYESAFVLPDGERITDKFTNTEKEVTSMKVLTTADIERRCRYRLGVHGLRTHKVKGNAEPLYYIYEDGSDDSVPEDDYRFLTLDQLLGYVEELEEKDAITRAESSGNL